jgi:exonuclease VII large subunit
MIRADLKTVNKERLLGHRTGLEDSYYRPEESEILQDYLKAVNLLTISEENRLKKQVAELKEQTESNEYIIKHSLQEKDTQIQDLKMEVTELENMFKGFVNIVDKGNYSLLRKYHFASPEEKLEIQEACGYNNGELPQVEPGA